MRGARRFAGRLSAHILEAMLAGRNRWLHAALYVIIVLGALHAQNAALAGEHHHDGGNSHCCDLCHHGQIPVVQKIVSAQPAPPTDLGWSTRPESGCACPERALVEFGGRAPPVSL